MADATVDKVKIEIEAEAVKAKSSIDDLIEKVGSLQAALNKKIDTKKLKESMQSFEAFREKIKDIGKDIKPAANLEGVNKQIEQLSSTFDKLAVKEENFELLGKNVDSEAWKKLQLDITRTLNGLEVLMDVQKQLSEESQQLLIGGVPFEEWYQSSQMAQEAAEETVEEFQEMGEAVQNLGAAPQIEAIRESISEIGAEAENVGADVEKLGGGAFSRLAEQMRSISASDVFGKMSASIKDFQSRVGMRVPTEEYKEIAANIEKAESELQKLLDKQDRMEAQGVSENSQSWKGLQYDIRVATDRVADFRRDMELLQESGGDTQGVGISSVFKGVSNAAKSSLDVIKRVEKVFQTFLGKVKGLAGGLSSTSGSMKRLNASAVPLSATFFKMGNLLKIMLMRLAIRGALDDVGTAFQHLAQKSSDFNARVSSLISACSQFSHQVAAMAQPLVNLFGPALTYIINLLSKATSYISQFLSALTGKSVFTSAKKVATDYAAGLDSVSDSANGASNAVKKMSGVLSGIDELNIITTNNDSSGGSSSGAGGLEDCYEELAIDQKILDLVKQVKDVMAQLFDPLKQAWDSKGQYVMDSWKSALSEIGQLAKTVGKDFLAVWDQPETVTVLSNILEIIGDIGQTVGNLAGNFRSAWSENNTGKQILENIRDIIGVIVENIKSASNATVTWSKDLDFSPLLSKIQTWTSSLIPVFDSLSGTVSDFYKTVLLPLGKWTVEKGLPDLIQVFIDFNEKVDWESLRSNLQTFWEHLEPFAETVGEGLVIFIGRVADGLANFLNSDTFVSFLQSVEDWMDSVDPEDVANGIQKLVTAFIALKAATVALDGALAVCKIVETFSKISGAIGSIGGVVASVIGAFGNIAEVFELVAGGAGTLGESIGAVFGTVGTVVSSIVAIVGGAVLSITSFLSMLQDGFSWTKELTMVLGAAIAAVGAIIAGVAAAPAAIVAALVAGLATLVVVIKEHWQQIFDFFTVTIPEWWTGTVIPFFKAIPEWFAGIWGSIKEFAVEKWGQLITFLQGLPEKISEVITSIGNWFSELPGKIGYALGYALGKITSWAIDAKDYLAEKIPEIIGNVKTWFSELPGKIYTAISTTVSKVAAWASNVSAKFKEKVSAICSSVKTWFSELPGKVYDAIIKVKEKITTWVTNVKGWCEKKIPQIVSCIVGFFEKIPDKLKALGKNIINGLLNGITEAWKVLKSKVSDFCSNFVGAFKSALGIHSPSKVFAQLGEYTVAGFNESIDKYGTTTSDVMQEWVDSFSDMSVSVGVGLSVDDSELSKLKNDYGFNRQMDINAMADYMNESLQTADGSQAELLRIQNEKLDKQNELLEYIAQKELSVSGDEVFSTVRRKANDYFRVNREPAFDF